MLGKIGNINSTKRLSKVRSAILASSFSVGAGTKQMKYPITFTESGDSVITSGQGWVQRNGSLQLLQNTLDAPWPAWTGFTKYRDQDSGTPRGFFSGDVSDKVVISLNANTSEWHGSTTTGLGIKHNTGISDATFDFIVELAETGLQEDTWEAFGVSIVKSGQTVPSLNDWIYAVYTPTGKAFSKCTKSGVSTSGTSSGVLGTDNVFFRIIRDSSQNIIVKYSTDDITYTTLDTWNNTQHNLGTSNIDIYLFGITGSISGLDAVGVFNQVKGDIVDDFTSSYTNNWTAVNTTKGRIFDGVTDVGNGILTKVSRYDIQESSSTFTAPRFYGTTLPNGDWKVWTHVTAYDQDTSYERFALFVSDDSDTALDRMAFGVQKNGSILQWVYRKTVGGTLTTVRTKTTTATDFYLLFERKDDTFLAYLSESSVPSDLQDPNTYEELFSAVENTSIAASARVGGYISTNATGKDASFVWYYFKGGQYPTSAQTATVKEFTPSSTVSSVDSIDIYNYNTTGTFTCDVQIADNGDTNWSTVVTGHVINANPENIDLSGIPAATGNKIARVIVYGQSSDGEDIGRVIDSVVYNVTLVS